MCQYKAQGVLISPGSCFLTPLSSLLSGYLPPRAVDAQRQIWVPCPCRELLSPDILQAPKLRDWLSFLIPPWWGASRCREGVYRRVGRCSQGASLEGNSQDAVSGVPYGASHGLAQVVEWLCPGMSTPDFSPSTEARDPTELQFTHLCNGHSCVAGKASRSLSPEFSASEVPRT